jgi:hypothetical protein
MEDNVKNKFEVTQFVRGVNFLSAVFLALVFRIEDFVIIVFYYVMYFYFWLYVTFILLEIRYSSIKKVPFFKHIFSHWLLYIGFLMPFFIVLFNKVLNSITD